MSSKRVPFTPHPESCRCPYCNKQRKLARGEVVAQPSPEQRRARASAAATALHQQAAAAAFDWATQPLDRCETRLHELRKEIEQGARTMQGRYDTRNLAFVPCEVCKKDIPNGRWHQSLSKRDPSTGLTKTIFLCNQLCITRYHQSLSNQPPAQGPTGLPKPEVTTAPPPAPGKVV